MKDVKRKIRAIDFFCGGGGMTYGLSQANIDVIAGVDIDVDAKATYEINNPRSTFIQADITKLKTNYFEENFSIKHCDNHLVLVGCSPCQYYSIVNTDKKNH